MWGRLPPLSSGSPPCAAGATLPTITGATLYLRYYRLDRRLQPSKFWDACLWIAFVSITCVATYAIYRWGLDKLLPILKSLASPTK